MKKTKRILSLILSIAMILGMLPAAAFAANNTFSDVKENDWFYDSVQYVYEKGMMVGTGANTFSPNETTTRGMVVAILHRLEGTPDADEVDFVDVPAGKWYANAVAWASANGIVFGYGNGLFGPDDAITREQMAAILYRYVQYKNYAAEITGDVSTFNDGSKVSTYAIEAMNWAVGFGLIVGVGDNTLVPTDGATRAQVAGIMTRFCNSIVPVSYTVTFDYNYEDKGAYKTVTVESGETIDEPESPSRSGYSFEGWYTAEKDGTKFDFVTIISGDITLYAHWTDNDVVPKTYYVTFDYNYNNAGTYKTVSVTDGNTVELPENPSRGGYSFEGWYTAEKDGTKFDSVTIISGDITLYAHWINDNGDDNPPSSGTTYTRGEWIEALAEKLDMNLDEDVSAIDYYFGDTAGHVNAVAIEMAQAYGILPPADVEDLEQDIPLFEPDEIATREFAAYTAVKAMGFDGTNAFDISAWADLTALLYPNEDAIAVGYHFLNLDSSGKFSPNEPILTSDVENVFDAIDAINASTIVTSDNAHDNSQYQDGVLKDELSSITDYTVSDNENGTYTVIMPKTNAAESIQEGNIIILPANDEHVTGISLCVNRINQDGEGSLVLLCEKPSIEDVFSTIDFAGVGTVIVDSIEPAEGVSCEYYPNDIDDNSITPRDIDLGGSGEVGKLKFTIKNKEFSENLKASGTVEIKIPDVTCIFNARIGLRETKVDEFTLSIQEEIKFKADLTYTLAESGYELTNGLGNTRFEKGRIELGRVPIAIGTTGLSFDIVVFYNIEAKGTASITYTITSTQGYQYKNGTSRIIFDYKDRLDFLELKGTASAGLGIAGDLCAFELMDIIGYSAEAGAAINVSFTPHIIATDTLFCGDATLYAYCKSGLDTETAVGKFLEKVCHYTLEFEHLKDNEKNPAKLKFHIENGQIVSECTFGTGTIEGYVESQDRHVPIANARISIYQEEVSDSKLIRTRYTDSEGKYSIDNITAGTYIVQVSATGYYTFTIDDVAVTETGVATYLETSLMIGRDHSGAGTVTGRITDALTGNGITDTKYVVRKGWNSKNGEKLQEGVFTENEYTLSLNAGNYTLEISKDNYITNYANIAISEAASAMANIILNPEGVATSGDSIRIILTWGEAPSDLDSHLFGPKVNNASGQFHTYYSNREYNNNGTQIANLDLDDTTGFGPETTTIYELMDTGTYSFYVHDYTNCSSSSSTAMSLSGAKVQVYSGSVCVATFNIPTYKEGTVWHVFDYDAETDTIIPVNTFSYSKTPSTLT